MNKLLKNGRLIAAVIGIIEILSFGIILLFALKFKPDFPYYFLVTILDATFFTFVEGIFYLVHNIKIRNLKRRTEIKAADILGNDIQEAYYFGKIGIILTDETNTILWINEFLEERNMTFVDKNIIEVFPELRQVVLSPNTKQEVTVKITFQNFQYEIKAIRELNLYLFKDITEFESLMNYSNEQLPVVGLLVIDNFADVGASGDETKVSDMIATVRKMITGYFSDHQVLIRSLKEDTYLLICSQKNYEEMYKEKFSIVDKVRDTYEDGYTLSIGISYGFSDYLKLMELASSALDVALSRGGDQTVISPFSENLEFIGGKTEARVARNRVRLRTISHSLYALISNANNILIMGHTNADFDAIGACLGIHAIARQADKKARIIFEDQFIEKKARRAVKSLFSQTEMQDIFISFKKANEFYNDNTLVVIVDCNNPKILLYPDLIEENTRVAIIDHHRRSENFLPNVIFNSIDASASSASEMIAEYISFNHQKIELDERYATLLLCGILLDTNHYRQHISIATYEASAFLKNAGADNEQADDFLKEDYEEYALKNKIMSTSETPYYGILVCTADENDIIDISMLAIVAREALNIRGVAACFAIGKTEENVVRISARSDGTVNCQIIMEKMGGGGHFTSSATEIREMPLADVKKQMLHILDEYLEQARSSTAGPKDNQN